MKILPQKKSHQELIGAILAAGEGTRIYPLNNKYPKPLLPVGNLPIIEHQINIMKKIGIRKFYIVVGYLHNEIKKYLDSRQQLNVQITYINQTKRLGIAYAIGLLESKITTPFLLFLGDIYFKPFNLKSIIKTYYQTTASAVIAVTIEKDIQNLKKNFAVFTASNSNSVIKVIEKPSYPSTNLKGCGIYLFDLTIFDAIRNTPRTALRDEYEITTSIQMLIEYGYSVHSCSVTTSDFNITQPNDLLKCNLYWLKSHNKSIYIGSSTDVNKNTKIINSVIRENVKILKPIKISDSLILENSIVNSSQPISKAIVTPDCLIQC